MLLKTPGIKYSNFTVSVPIQHNSVKAQDATIHINVTLGKKNTKLTNYFPHTHPEAFLIIQCHSPKAVVFSQEVTAP